MEITMNNMISLIRVAMEKKQFVTINGNDICIEQPEKGSSILYFNCSYEEEKEASKYILEVGILEPISADIKVICNIEDFKCFNLLKKEVRIYQDKLVKDTITKIYSDLIESKN